jgi:hypothetical protein
MRKIRFILFIAVLFLVGCNSSQNRETPDKTTDYQQTTKLETTTETTTPVETTTEEPTTPVPEPTEAALAIRAVLKNERPYIDVNNGYKETYKKDLNYYLGKTDLNLSWENFVMFDADNDGQREVMVIVRNLRLIGNHTNLEDRLYLILRYYQGQVYGYQSSQIMYFGNNNYFGWNSRHYEYMEDDEEYSGGGKIEFNGDKIKYIYYMKEKNEKERKWLESLIPGADVEIIVDKKMCEYAEKEGEEGCKYEVGDARCIEDIDAYIY